MRNILLHMAIAIQRPFFRDRSVRVDFPIIEPDGTRLGVEGIWCKRLGFDIFEVDNVPFAARGISIQDIVECGWSAAGWGFIEKRISGGFGCARVYAAQGNLRELWEEVVKELDVRYEFASESRAAVAAVPEVMEQLVSRLSGLSAVAIEVTA